MPHGKLMSNPFWFHSLFYMREWIVCVSDVALIAKTGLLFICEWKCEIVSNIFLFKSGHGKCIVTLLIHLGCASAYQTSATGDSWGWDSVCRKCWGYFKSMQRYYQEILSAYIYWVTYFHILFTPTMVLLGECTTLWGKREWAAHTLGWFGKVAEFEQVQSRCCQR